MNFDQARQRAERAFKQEERERDGKTAMAQYQADAIALREKTARLRALRLAKEGETRQQAAIGAQNDRRKASRK